MTGGRGGRGGRGRKKGGKQQRRGEPFYYLGQGMHKSVFKVNFTVVPCSRRGGSVSCCQPHCSTAVRSNTNCSEITDEQYTTINQSTAGRFDPRVFVNCLQVTCKQLTKTLGSKHPAVD